MDPAHLCAVAWDIQLAVIHERLDWDGYVHFKRSGFQIRIRGPILCVQNDQAWDF